MESRQMPDTPAISQIDIIFTTVDEAPRLASASFLPIVRAYAEKAGISVGTRDISLAGRILAQFPDELTTAQEQRDDLADLGALVNDKKANIIKLPNISASIPQLKSAIKELQAQGYAVPNFPENPESKTEESTKAIYNKILGSAVNPILREGNSDRRAPSAVKAFAKKNPHRMGEWSRDSKTHVASMTRDDFRSNETSVTISNNLAGNAQIKFIGKDGSEIILKDQVPLIDGEIVDATFMNVRALQAFYRDQITDAKEKGILFSLHLKATMMKVSDPVLFGHAVRVFFSEVFDKNHNLLNNLGVNPNNGLGDLLSKISELPDHEKQTIESDLRTCIESQPALYMVNSDKGITNLHVPSDVIVDASMPSIIRNGGKGWAPNGSEREIKCVIPDSSYAGVYEETIKFCIKHGAFNPTSMGSVSNVGLMAQKAEEYGSHPQTFIAPDNGIIIVTSKSGEVLHQHDVEVGDIWRMCQVKDGAIENWINLGVSRARATGSVAIFWLDKNRAHDLEMIKKVEKYLGQNKTSGLDIRIMSPIEATRFSLEKIKNGEDTISVTGNVLRDYLTDLFPILELGTSAKMLSIVPLMNGGGLFETGAGGSAPKHVQQLLEQGHLRWDSLGEFTALAAAFEHLSDTSGNKRAATLARCLNLATEKLLDNNQSPGRSVGDIDNRGSHFYLALYWSEALAAQNDHDDLKIFFAEIAKKLSNNESIILAEFKKAQGLRVDIGGYYHPDPLKVTRAMRPSETFNEIID
jgi:isocitrate dehydrogenase